MHPLAEQLQQIGSSLRTYQEPKELLQIARTLERLAEQTDNLGQQAVSFREQLFAAQRRLESLDIEMPWECYWFGHCGDQTESGYHVCDRCGLHAYHHSDAYYSVSGLLAFLVHEPRRIQEQVIESLRSVRWWVDDLKHCAHDLVFGSRHPDARHELRYYFRTRVVDPVESVFRRFVPRKCPDCGKRKCELGDQCIPF